MAVKINIRLLETEGEHLTAKEQLERYQQISEEINELCEELVRLRTLVYSGGRGGLDGMPRSKKNMDAAYTNIVAKIVDLQADIDRKVDERIDLKRDLIQSMTPLEDWRLRRLLYMRYIQGADWQTVADAVGRNVSHVRSRMHPKALEKINQNIVPGY